MTSDFLWRPVSAGPSPRRRPDADPDTPRERESLPRASSREIAGGFLGDSPRTKAEVDGTDAFVALTLALRKVRFRTFPLLVTHVIFPSPALLSRPHVTPNQTPRSPNKADTQTQAEVFYNTLSEVGVPATTGYRSVALDGNRVLLPGGAALIAVAGMSSSGSSAAAKAALGAWGWDRPSSAFKPEPVHAHGGAGRGKGGETHT